MSIRLIIFIGSIAVVVIAIAAAFWDEWDWRKKG